MASTKTKLSIAAVIALLLISSTVVLVLHSFISRRSPAAVSAEAGGLLGRWELGETERVEFRPDGTCEGTDQYGRRFTGRFELLGANRMKWEVSTTTVDERRGTRFVDKASGVVRFVLQSDSLTLTEGSVQKHFRRTPGL